MKVGLGSLFRLEGRSIVRSTQPSGKQSVPKRGSVGSVRAELTLRVNEHGPDATAFRY
jgi:hypothetical protein